MTADELRELVATMRELGVTECGDVKLGPPPTPTKKPLTLDEQAAIAKDRALLAEERQRDVLFAASHVKPALARAK